MMDKSPSIAYGDTMTRYLIVPGWGGSDEDHWQAHWERSLPNATSVVMPDWFEPKRIDWLATLDCALRARDEPTILIAHSLGCIAVAHWAATTSLRVRGALLVAPADVERDGCPEFLRNFAPIPRERIRFPSHVIASDDDPHLTVERAMDLAKAWKSDLTILEKAGHINTKSGFGAWIEGRRFLAQFEREDRRVESDDDTRSGYPTRFPSRSASFGIG